MIKIKFKKHFVWLIIISLFLNLGVLSCGEENLNTQQNQPKQLSVHFIDVGQADSIFIDYGDYDILIDGGNNTDGDLVVNYLKSLNVDDIEIMVATHNHEDHIGGLDNVLKAYDVENIIDSGDKTTTTKTYKDYWNAVENENSKYKEDDNLTFNIDDGIEFKILEMGDNFKDTNSNSVVCMLDYNNTEFLFMGDLESEVENKNLDKFTDVDVLKLGHHGSKTSTSKEFLDIAKPEYGIISCGKDNKYGHPNTETLSKLIQYNIKTFRTDTQGHIIATTDGETITFILEPFKLNVDEVGKNDTDNTTINTKQNNVIKNNPPTNETKNKIVYITKTGKKYHNEGCSGLRRSKFPIDLEKAKEKGYTPCSKCNP